MLKSSLTVTSKKKKKKIPKSCLAEIAVRPKVTILGAGVGGCFAALALAALRTPDGEPKYDILIIEKNPVILTGSSNITPGRMGLGFHYVHLPTALMYLAATIEFQKKFSAHKDFRIGAGENNPNVKYKLQHGRYFITKDSKQTPEEILNTYQAIQEEYAKLVKADPTNEVFGPPDQFFRILKPEEYQDYINTDKVVAGIETPECLLDWPEFRKFIIAKLNSHKNIQIKTNLPAAKISVNDEEISYEVTCIEDNGINKELLTYKSDILINCTWQEIEQLNATAGLQRKDIYTNRLKALVTVNLPPSLYDKPSAFFCMGPHAMFSNLGGGKGAMTFAPVTSMFSSPDTQVPEKINYYLNGKASLEESMAIGTKIRDGVCEYIKDMKAAEIEKVRFGIVQSKGEVDIFNHESAFNLRDYNGIDEKLRLGFIVNACMKLLYGPANGELVKEIVEDHNREITGIKKFSASLAAYNNSASFKNKSAKISPSDLHLTRFALERMAVKKALIAHDKNRLKKAPVAAGVFFNLSANPSTSKDPHEAGAASSAKSLHELNKF